MTAPRGDRLSVAAMLVGGACIAAVFSLLLAVLRAPAVPRPRGVTAVVEPVAPPPAYKRDNDRVPSLGDTENKARAAPPPVVSTPSPPATTDGGAAADGTPSRPQ